MITKITRRRLRKLINEVTKDACNTHSLGWIDPQGTFHDITTYMEIHDEWMDSYQAVKLGNYDWVKGTNPPGWIKVSNAKELWYGGDWKDVKKKSPRQFNAMFQMWTACAPFCEWLQKDVEKTLVTFGSLTTGQKQQFTIPDFIGMHLGRDAIFTFYGMLLGGL